MVIYIKRLLNTEEIFGLFPSQRKNVYIGTFIDERWQRSGNYYHATSLWSMQEILWSPGELCGDNLFRILKKTSTAVVRYWSYVYSFGNCERRADRGKKNCSGFRKCRRVYCSLSVHSWYYSTVQWIHSPCSGKRTSKLRLGDRCYLEIYKNQSHCFPSFETFPILAGLYMSPLVSLTCHG